LVIPLLLTGASVGAAVLCPTPDVAGCAVATGVAEMLASGVVSCVGVTTGVGAGVAAAWPDGATVEVKGLAGITTGVTG